MSPTSSRLGIVIPTKDRPRTLHRLLESIAAQSHRPAEIIVADGGSTELAPLLESFASLPLRHIKVRPPGLTRQKNAGVAALHPMMTLVAVLDDDITLEAGALGAMQAFWDQAPPEVGGASFNLVGARPDRPRWVRLLWKIFLIDNGGVGVLQRSGYNTPISDVRNTQFVHWLNGGSTVWRREVFATYRFDEWFARNGWCEDVRFSGQVGARYRLAVVADARAQHVEVPGTLRAQFQLGCDQILNRLYVVRSNADCSLALCWWSLIGQLLMNMGSGVATCNAGRLMRAAGNLVGMGRALAQAPHRAGCPARAADAPRERAPIPVSLSVVVPAYNEANNLGRVVEEIVQFLRQHVERFELIVVDDGSSDETPSVLQRLSARFSEVRTIRHPTNRGYGASLRDGFASSRFAWLFFTDADHQFRIDSLLELLPLRDRADLIVGFRRDRRDPWVRRVLSYGYNLLMRLLFGIRVRDIDCAFKLFHRRVLESVQIESQRFFVNTELLVKAGVHGFHIVERGVDHFPRDFDRSKVSLREIPRTIREVIRIWRIVHRSTP